MEMPKRRLFQDCGGRSVLLMEWVWGHVRIKNTNRNRRIHLRRVLRSL